MQCIRAVLILIVTIQTAGSGLPEAVINNLADPDGFREAVLQARKAYREGLVPLTLSQII